MKITQITYTARKGMPSYSHEEIVAVAMIAEGVDQVAQIALLKSQVNSVLHGTEVSPAITQTVVENGQTVVDKTPFTGNYLAGSPSTPTANENMATPKQTTKTRTKTVETKPDGTVTAQLGSEPEAVLNLPKKEELKEAPKTEAPKETKKNIEKYDRSVKEHTSAFSAFLNKTYGETWKTKEGLKAFSESLTGIEFRDQTTGLLVDSFKAKIETFFGNGENVL